MPIAGISTRSESSAFATWSQSYLDDLEDHEDAPKLVTDGTLGAKPLVQETQPSEDAKERVIDIPKTGV